MSIKSFRHYFFIKSPWSFLVSTASLFLIIAVLFFHLFVFSFEDYFVINVVSFMSLASKTKPKVLYLGGSVLANQAYYKYYTFRPIGIGKAHWNPDNYSAETQSIIDKFLFYLNIKDKNAVYGVMYAVLGNKEGLFSQNYGKVTSINNNMVAAYNKQNPDNPLTEKEFLDQYSYNYTEHDLNFLNNSNRGTVMSNISEVLAKKVVIKYNSNLLIERNFISLDKVNLSFQKNSEYTIGLFIEDISSKKITLVIYDSDLKITEKSPLGQKFIDLDSQQKLNLIEYDKSILGMNIIILATKDKQDSDIIFTREQAIILINHIKSIQKDYPEQFKNFDENSKIISEFKETGKASLLNNSNFPVTHFFRPIEFYKLPHNVKKFEETSAYKVITDQLEKREGTKKSNSNISLIEEITDDNNN